MVVAKATEGDVKGLYNWAYRVGLEIVCGAFRQLGESHAKNHLLRIVKELRAEASPERFRSKFVSLLSEAMGDFDVPILFPKVLKVDERLRLDEFNRISSLILMGLWDALATFIREKDKDKFCSERKGGE